MLSDRPYMRDDYPRERTSVLTWLISVIVAGFVVQFITSSSWVGAGRGLEQVLGLSVPTLENGRIWTLLTHSLLHSTDFIVHVIFNVFALYFLGRELLPMLGAKRFLGLYVAATFVGGCAWSAVHWRFGGGEMHLGATAAVAAYFTVFACFFPNQRLNFLLFFVVPVSLKPKHLAFTLVGLSAITLLVYELPGMTLPWNMALSSSAHLGGMLTGFLYFRYVHDAHWGRRRSSEIELPRWMKRGRKTVATDLTVELDVSPPVTKGKDDLRAEVDRILDKINSEGFGSLTPAEKQVLDDAKEMLSRR